jgi:hypothetical protein
MVCCCSLNVSFKEFLALLIFALFVGIRSTVFDGLFVPFYSSTNFAYFAIFVRCGINRFSTDSSNGQGTSLLVSFFNNCHLNLLRYIIYPFIFYGFLDFLLLKAIVQAIFISTVVWMLMPEKVFASLRYIWAYLCMEYLISLPYSLIDALNNVMKYQHGHLLMVIVVVYLETSLLLGGLSIPFVKSSFFRALLPKSCLYYTIMVPLIFYL